MRPMRYDSITEQSDGLGIAYQGQKYIHQSTRRGRDSSKSEADSKSYLGPWGHVYFIQSLIDGDHPGPIKIGWTNKGGMARRVHNLQNACPYELRVRGGIDAPKLAERRIHNHFYKHRMRGEWFEPDPEILEFLGYVEKNGLPAWALEEPVLKRKPSVHADLLAELVKRCAEPFDPDETVRQRIERAADRLGITVRAADRYWYGYGGPQIYKRLLPTIERALADRPSSSGRG